ncbi:MAG: UMP kinase [Candidatus Ryanbacteria bacterium RIFCSPHIGHO2_02_FULL_45_17b]|uniref:Uridylate kinase n=1 Tax=Candidatus Ryanbacteria bacterium RIFCSPHIGHO2_01_FULL_45_22 TaxID=1802114 RepID=A0A1G2G0Q4_9BACT|nr:MAG: UMP kinase [Candidatus Ryanbacteria bacterium RIFCSPHIGHO2_01_FULL_45_22]OGZ47445.1 MAG: UMP kinase [Candidatus Ryanbacteria bacterium RIFCSPHIGHO2_02_FULL_45_17b]
MKHMGYSLYLLKLTGEALVSDGEHFSISAGKFIAEEIQSVVSDHSVRLAIVVGGGNVVRGLELERQGFERKVADNMGMLATVQNALLLEYFLEQCGVSARCMTAIPMNHIAEPYIYKRALRHINKGRVVVLSGGIGEPYVSTDFAAVQRACQLDAVAILKGTKVDGIYDADPKKKQDAKFIHEITYDEVLQRRLEVMDEQAFSHARNRYKRPTYIFNIFVKGNLARVVRGEKIGSVILEAYPAEE